MESPLIQQNNRGRGGWLLLVFVLPVLVAAALVYVRVRLHVEVMQKIGNLAAEGLPRSGAELNAWVPSVQPERNGALDLSRAFALLRALPPDLVTNTEIFHTNLWAEGFRASVGKCIKSNIQALTFIDKALQFPEFRYPVDYSSGYSTLLPHLGKVRQSVVLLGLRAGLAAEEGQTNEWPELLVEQIRLSDSLENEGSRVGLMTRGACLTIAGRTAKHALRCSTPNPAACRKLQRTFLRAAETNLLARALIVERAMAIPAFRMSFRDFRKLSKNDGIPIAHKLRASGSTDLLMAISGYRERDLNYYLGVMEKGIALAREPAPLNLQLTNHFERSFRLAGERSYVLSDLLLEPLRDFSFKEVNLQAHLRIIATVFAIEAFRQTRGRVPSDLKELVPEFMERVPADPFDDAPLRYTVLNTGYRLYSIGADGYGGLTSVSLGRTIFRFSDLVFTANR